MTTSSRRQRVLRRNRTDRRGFTIIEVMIVLLILMTLAGVGIIAVNNTMDSANKRQAAIKIGEFKTPIEMFRLHVGRLPDTSEGLDALLVCPSSLPNPDKWEGPYMSVSAIPLDPWDMPYQYAQPGTHSSQDWEVWSFGPDKLDGTDDDICSWK